MKQKKSMTINPFDKGDVRYFTGIRKREKERFKYLEHKKVTPKSVIISSYGRIISGDENVKIYMIYKEGRPSPCVSITDNNLKTKTILTLSHLIADAFIPLTDRDKKLHRNCICNKTKTADVRYTNLKRHSKREIAMLSAIKKLDKDDSNYYEKAAIIVHKLMDDNYTADDILYVLEDYLSVKNKKEWISKIYNKETYSWVQY